RGAMVVDGSGKPAAGPCDIVVEGDTIKEVVSLDPVAIKSKEARRPAPGDLEIDATGKYVLPGLIDLHAHIHDERGGVPMPVEYCWKLWLANGITTVREVGGNTPQLLVWGDQSRRGDITAPRCSIDAVYDNPA